MASHYPDQSNIAERSRVLHATASDAFEAKPAAKPLRLALHGLGDDESSVLEAILRVLGERTARRWILGDGSDCDLLLTTRDAAPHTTRATLTALLLREDESPAAPDELALQVPLRVMAVYELLHAVQDRLRQMPALPRVTSEQPRVEIDDGKSLAAALSRLIERRPEQALRVRIVGHGTLYVCLKSNVYHCDFPRERFADALNEHRFVVTMIPSSAAEIVVRLEEAWPLDEALWQIGLITAGDSDESNTKAYRLTRWPDFARLPHRPEFLKVCAVMARTHQSLDALVALGGLRRCEIEHLLHACALCGYLDIVTRSAADATAPSAPAVAPRTGLFERLRKRFGL